MTQARAPTSLQPRAKAAPTSITSTASATILKKSGSSVPGSSLVDEKWSDRPSDSLDDDENGRPSHHSPVKDPALAPEATEAFVRRTLCANKGNDSLASLNTLLPPLTSSNDVDLQLYAILAVIIRDYVLQWYSKISPNQDFIDELIQVVAHCTRGIEERLRRVDLTKLVMDELPSILDDHITTYRASQSLSRASYHALHPHPAMSPVPDSVETAEAQRANEAAYRHLLVQKMLGLLLPSEESQNECLRALVGEIFSELILGNIIDRFSRGRAWSEAIEKSIDVLASSSTATVSLPGQLVGLAAVMLNSVRAVLVSLTRASLSKDTMIPAVANDRPTMLEARLLSFINNLLQLSERVPWLISPMQWTAQALMHGPGRIAAADGILDRTLLSLVHVHVLHPSRLPAALVALRGALFPANHFLSSPPTELSQGLLLLPEHRDTGNDDPRQARNRCARRIVSLVPIWAWSTLFGISSRDSTAASPPASPSLGRTSDDQSPKKADSLGEEEPDTATTTTSMRALDEGGVSASASASIVEILSDEVLNVFDDPYANRHLCYALLELVLVRVMPELGPGDDEQST